MATNPDSVDPPTNTTQLLNGQDAGQRRESFSSQNSQTAREFLESQMRLEADAREVLPYSFDTCTQALGPLRQSLFACLTCNPPPSDPDAPHTAAGVCYACSISCHGEHTLVELFNKRNFVCDCGTTRVPSTSPCTLREDPQSGKKGVHSETPHPDNKYNHNFENKFCGCGEDYDANKERGTMFQCLGLGSAETGGCGEDWWHPECLIGLPRNWYEEFKKEANGDKQADEDEEDEIPLPPGFPLEDDFETFICFKCVESNQWLKSYAGTAGFLPPVSKEGGLPKVTTDVKPAPETSVASANQEEQSANSKKRKAEDDDAENEPVSKRTKEDDIQETPTETKAEPKEEQKPDSETTQSEPAKDKHKHKHDSLPSSTPSGTFSLFLKEDFRDHFCRCPECYPNLSHHPQLREEEETYEPPLSEIGDDANGGGSTGTGSIYDRGEAALNNMDRVRAIEGAMVYNHLRDKVKEFLKPFAESGTAVGADDIKSYFEKLRGDEQPMRDAAGQASRSKGDDDNDNDGNRQEQSGY
ncbi:putative metaphase-anaphase transition protein [Aspergillus steynii IBT 23096]|uniref:Putative metaphase-anaphase transition protein n=1 Tax=Aspergillus steynii IBT 23096 TaxID=1392250 RepID=A0A2I2GKJ6_9EURO|nr:putative metaphase-anaphase transition protein [Aspergillus steynii IBT 23096]PLB53394.1 putative metaphase-anaphase transition protein [Aspergillus steynii IBT 23096]